MTKYSDSIEDILILERRGFHSSYVDSNMFIAKSFGIPCPLQERLARQVKTQEYLIDESELLDNSLYQPRDLYQVRALVHVEGFGDVLLGSSFKERLHTKNSFIFGGETISSLYTRQLKQLDQVLLENFGSEVSYTLLEYPKQ